MYFSFDKLRLFLLYYFLHPFIPFSSLSHLSLSHPTSLATSPPPPVATSPTRASLVVHALTMAVPSSSLRLPTSPIAPSSRCRALSRPLPALMDDDILWVGLQIYRIKLGRVCFQLLLMRLCQCDSRSSMLGVSVPQNI